MPNTMLERLVREREEVTSRVEHTTAAANEANNGAGRDLTDQDREVLTRCQSRIGEIDAQLELLSSDAELNEGVRNRLARLQPGVVQPGEVQYRTAGQLLWDCVHATFGGRDVEDQMAQQRYNRVLTRAAEHMGTSADATVPVAGGLGALVVAPVVGPVIDVMPSGRPFLTALGVRPAPSPLGFVRPRIIDPNLTTGVDVQTKEKAELVSKHFDIGTDNLSLVTVGGYLNVSQQLLALVPSSLDIIVGQLNRRLALATERAAITELEKSTAKIPLAADADGATILQAIYDASALVFQNTGELATWIAMGPQGWARLGGLSDLAGRPLFPYLGATNAYGSTSADQFAMVGPAGLRSIVTPGIDDATFWVGNSNALEAYEYRYPVLEAVEPSLLGRQIAVASSIVNYRPTTKEAGPANTPPAEANGAVHLAP